MERDSQDIKPTLSANQLTAKVMHLHMKGKHQEADKLLKEAEGHEGKSKSINSQGVRMHEKKKKEDADMHLACSILQNKEYKADDEYDYEEGPKKKKQAKSTGNTCILTQQERCNFCFDNPKRPQHLVIAIANFSYLTLPQSQQVVPGHCCKLPMQHELATTSVEDNVWDELRNFKKCVIMMFAKQGRDVVFLETVMGLAKERRHCLVERIPLPPQVAKQAPLFFKKAIDEAEEEWSQHNQGRPKRL